MPCKRKSPGALGMQISILWVSHDAVSRKSVQGFYAITSFILRSSQDSVAQEQVKIIEEVAWTQSMGRRRGDGAIKIRMLERSGLKSIAQGILFRLDPLFYFVTLEIILIIDSINVRQLLYNTLIEIFTLTHLLWVWIPWHCIDIVIKNI